MQISAKCKKKLNHLKINILDLFLPAKTGSDHKTLAYQSRCLCFLTEMCASWANSRTKWVPVSEGTYTSRERFVKKGV